MPATAKQGGEMQTGGKTGLAALAALVVMAGNVLAVGSGSVNPTSGWYPAGTNLTVTATPAVNDELKGWSGDTNSATFGAATITFLVNAPKTIPKTITATFKDIMHTITASVTGNGSIDPVGANDVAQGDSLAFSISPSANHHIADVLIDGGSIGVTNSYTFSNVMASHTIAAFFAIDTYEVNFLQGLHGTLSGQPTTQTIDHGSDALPPTINAAAGYAPNGWDGSYTGITSARTLTALYTTNSYTLTFDSAGGSAVADITQPYTTAVTAPTPPTKTGYSFAGWNPPVPATMPLDGGSHTAQWTANNYSVIIISSHGESTPPVGTNLFAYGSTVDVAIVESPLITPNVVKYDATGWTSTGSLASGSGTNTSFVITNNTTMTWQWSTNYWIEIGTAGE